MKWFEILLIVASCLFVIVIFSIYIKKIIKKEPIDDCGCHKINTKKILKEYHKKYNIHNDK